MVFLHIDKKNADNFLTKNKNGISLLDDYLKKRHIFILIYMDGCGPCNAVRPEWKKIENVLKDYTKREDVIIIDIDKDLLSSMSSISSPNSFPTMRYITNDGKIVENYEDSNIQTKDRSIDSFVKWIESKSKNNGKNKTFKRKLYKRGKSKKMIGGKWSLKYKKSINCRKPKGFSQKQYCKYGRKK